MKYLFIVILFLVSSKSNSQIKVKLDSLSFDSIKNSLQSNLGKELNQFSFISTKGKLFSNQMLVGKTTLINFWFETCAPCIAEFYDLNLLYSKFKSNDKFQFISFTIDKKDNAVNSAKKYKLKFPIICLTEQECRKINFNSGFPLSIVINENGKIIYIKAGGAIKTEAIKTQIESLSNIILNSLPPLLVKKNNPH